MEESWSPVSVQSGVASVELSADHPGVDDPVYRARRDAIAAIAVGHRRGDPVKDAVYSDEEQAVWRTVQHELAPLHQRFAATAYLDAVDRLALPVDRIPQLQEVTDALRPLTGFCFEPVAGLAPLRSFYGSFAESTFCSTQYIRHHSVPLYTPEPDVIHELVGHANQLASPVFAEVCRQVGLATLRTSTPEALRFLSKVFWFTLEFGVVHEPDGLKAYGAGLLSSFGEMGAFRGAEVRPFDIAAMGTLDYDITHYQPLLFAAESPPHLEDALLAFFGSWDDDAHARLDRRQPVAG